MSLSTHMLEAALERSTLLVPEVPGHIRWLSLPGIEGRITSLDHPIANAVGAAAFSDQDAASRIGQIKGIFSAEGKGLTWVVGPISSPRDLGARLLAAGFVKWADIAGMVLTDLDSPIQGNPEICIRRASRRDLEVAAQVMTGGFHIPEEVTRLFMEARLSGSTHPRSDIYMAFLGDRDTPVGCASLDYVPDTPIARLGGSVTLKEHRGKGVYTSLVAQRVADAAAEGMEAIVIQSARVSSEPICRKLGFREICDMAMYSWTPPAQGATVREMADEWTV